MLTCTDQGVGLKPNRGRRILTLLYSVTQAEMSDKVP
jgi:hypothetical protein